MAFVAIAIKTDEIHKTVNNSTLCFRHQKVSMVATCFAVTGATPPDGRDAQNAADVNFTGVAMLSVKSVSEMYKFQHVTERVVAHALCLDI